MVTAPKELIGTWFLSIHQSLIVFELQTKENDSSCLISFCRMLVYEYVNNGNLEQWLHGDVGPRSPLTWENRMNIIMGTAKGYDSDQIELPKLFSFICCVAFLILTELKLQFNLSS